MAWNKNYFFHLFFISSIFGIEIIDNEHVLTVKLDEYKFIKMLHDEKIEALKYVVQVKKALEMNGAVVLVTRDPVPKP